MTAMILDTETTGLAEPVRPVQIAWVEFGSWLHDSDGEIHVQNFNPGREIEFGALGTHHITLDQVADAPSWETFKLPDGTKYLIGQNIDYDWDALGKPDVKRICTYAIARALWPEFDSHSLGPLMYALKDERGIKMARDHHDASTDVTMTWLLLLNHILPRMPKILTWDRLWEASERARIPKTWPFGEHKGKPLAVAPKHYVEWALKQEWLDPYLRLALMPDLTQ